MTNNMHPELKRMCETLDRVDVDYTTDAIKNLRNVLYDLIAHVQRISPEDKSDDI